MKAFEYGVCRHPDEEIYIKQRQLLLKNIPGLTFVEELVDVDESKFSIMMHERGRVVLKNSFFLNEVCIESDFDISPYFEWIYRVNTLRQGVFFSEQITILKAAV